MALLLVAFGRIGVEADLPIPLCLRVFPLIFTHHECLLASQKLGL